MRIQDTVISIDSRALIPPLTQGSTLETQPKCESADSSATEDNSNSLNPFNGGGIQRSLKTGDYLTSCLLGYAASGFNNLPRLTILWMAAHMWPEDARFTFNCYRHFSQILIRVLGDRVPRIILSR